MKGFRFTRMFTSVSPFGSCAVKVPKHAAWRRKSREEAVTRWGSCTEGGSGGCHRRSTASHPVGPTVGEGASAASGRASQLEAARTPGSARPRAAAPRMGDVGCFKRQKQAFGANNRTASGTSPTLPAPLPPPRPHLPPGHPHGPATTRSPQPTLAAFRPRCRPGLPGQEALLGGGTTTTAGWLRRASTPCAERERGTGAVRGSARRC